MTDRGFYFFYSVGVVLLISIGFSILTIVEKSNKNISTMMRSAAEDFPQVLSDVKEIRGQMDQFSDRFDEMAARLERLEKKR